MKFYKLLCLVLFAIQFGVASDTLKIASYNLLNYSGAEESSKVYFRRIIKAINSDILVAQEMIDVQGVNHFRDSVLNVVYTNAYTSVPFHDGFDTDNSLFYKSSKISLISANYVTTTLRDIADYLIQDLASGEEIHILSVHLKASIDQETARLNEAIILRNYLNTFPANTNIIITGDFNFYRSTETGFQKLIGNESNNNGQVKDPLNAVGIWNNNASFSSIHTQSPRIRSFGGGSTGGLDDRFDLLLTSNALDDNIIISTYTAFGNDGNHFNDSINHLPNTAVPDSIANALHNASDHLPIYCKFVFGSINQPPVATNQSITLFEDSLYNGFLSGFDADNDTMRFSIVSQALKGIAAISNNLTGAFSYSPFLNMNGIDSFTFHISDGSTFSNTATVTVSIIPQNDAPVANQQTIVTNEDVNIAGTLTANDVDNSSLTFSIVAQGEKGITNIQNATTGSFIYAPYANMNGIDTFYFRANDGILNSNTEKIILLITTVNDTPLAYNQNISTSEDSTTNIVLTGFDIDENSLLYNVIIAPVHGTISGLPPTLNYTPAVNYFGNDSIGFIVNDGIVNSDTAYIHIAINSVNDKPIADDKLVTTMEDSALAIVISGSDTDDAMSLQFSILSNPQHGILSGTIPALTFTPALNYNGSDLFQFTVSDGELKDTGTITINISPVNDKPTASNIFKQTSEDISVTIQLIGATVDIGEQLYFTITQQPLHGTLDFEHPSVNYTFRPNLNYFGTDSLKYIVADSQLTSDTATVTISILPVNDLPVGNANVDSVKINQEKNITLRGTDIDDTILTFNISTSPANGTLSNINFATGVVTYTPALFFTGTDSFYFRVNDGKGSSTPTKYKLIVYKNFDSTSYRTFSQTDFLLSSIKIPKKGTRPMPTAGNIRDTIMNNAFGKSKIKSDPNYPGGVTLGIVRHDSLKNYGWIRFLGKGDVVKKFLPQTGESRGFDVVGIISFKKELKNPKMEKYNNSLAVELLALKFNLAASKLKITHAGLDSLVYDDPADTTHIFHNKTLKEITLLVDTALTYYKRYYPFAPIPSVYTTMTLGLERINSAFRTTIDTQSVSPLRLKNNTPLGEITFLRRTESGKEILNEIRTPAVENFSLLQNYPNPFNATTTISFQLPSDEKVTLQIFNILGQMVTTVLNNVELERGYHQIIFDESQLSSGMFFYRLSLSGGKLSITNRMLLLK